MLLETVFWVISVGLITYNFDVMLLNSINKMSDDHHFIIFNFLFLPALKIFYKIFLPERKKKLSESLIWVTFIITMSISCRNRLGDDLDTFHFLVFSLVVLYFVYVYRLIHPKEEKFIPHKIILITSIVLKIFWPTIVYLWPYGSDYPDNYDWTDWPYINF